jgi:hypothetical protein
VGEWFGGLDASAQLIQVPFDRGNGLAAVAADEGRREVGESGEAVGLEGSTQGRRDRREKRSMEKCDALL